MAVIWFTLRVRRCPVRVCVVFERFYRSSSRWQSVFEASSSYSEVLWFAYHTSRKCCDGCNIFWTLFRISLLKFEASASKVSQNIVCSNSSKHEIVIVSGVAALRLRPEAPPLLRARNRIWAVYQSWISNEIWVFGAHERTDLVK